MERHANYALVGALTTLLALAGLIFVVWLGDASFGETRDRYGIVFQGPVRGLSKGGEVQFNGLKVGEVARVGLAAGDPSKVLAEILVEGDTPIRVDSLATIEALGISGVNAVQISAGSMDRPLLQPMEGEDLTLIRSKSGSSSLLEGGGVIVGKATETLDRVNRVLSDRAIVDLTGVAADLKLVTTELAANRAMIGNAATVIAKLDAAATDVGAAARTTRELVDGDGRRTMAGAADAVEELQGTLVEARTALRAIGSDTNGALAEVRSASEAVTTLVERVSQDPRGTLTRGSGKEREVKP